MRPSVALLFPPLAAAGTGLLAWLGISVVLLHARADLMPALYPLQASALLLGGALVVIALVGRRMHARDNAALSAPAWTRRADLAAVTALAIAAALFVVLRWVPAGPNRALVLGLLGLALAAAALLAIAGAALATREDGADPLRIPARMLLALTLGLALLFCLMACQLPSGRGNAGMLLTLALLGLLLAASALVRWREHDRSATPMREARRARLIHAALLAAPLACWVLATVAPAMVWLLVATAALVLAGILEHAPPARFATEYGAG
ncbi:hypothetical protein [Luteimonas sp. MHLX1A]|uniref:hypothetical protein n=1 Tax=Alterluteimonas muca TaxID=2878684 RepID=UPI001E4DBF29|nr:hypothetical protein [Luteimonas sp. MHLX1A]MCD9045380.1 hypothetical protein [Luteimonas sp. MHLX1A]